MTKAIGSIDDDDSTRRKRLAAVYQWYLEKSDNAPASSAPAPAAAPTSTEAPTTAKDVVEANRTGNTWMKKIKAVPKPVAATKPQTLQGFEPASNSRGLKQAQTQHDHIGPSLGAGADRARELDGKIAAFALDQRSPTDVANLTPAITDAIAQREGIMGPAAARIAHQGTAEEKERFAIYERWMGNVLAIAERRIG